MIIKEILEGNREADIQDVIFALEDGEYISVMGWSQDEVEAAHAEACEIKEWLKKVIYTGDDGHDFVPREYLEEILESDNKIKAASEWISMSCDNCDLDMPPSDEALTLAARYVTKGVCDYE